MPVLAIPVVVTSPPTHLVRVPLPPRLRRQAWRRTLRRGMTLVEVILAIVILSGTMLGLGNFARKFQSANSGSTSKTLASDLAAQRVAEILAYRPYSSIVSTYHN
ncbi:MAG TPA: prepilin-type N-terminal cleavage/methylation domain-containing protein, partial [Gemmatimonadaceae bacterium]|nr:prepilin-type N-terminal cleavage/methylation domain-containing protein [Gemmatimonadaceae bacterium]